MHFTPQGSSCSQPLGLVLSSLQDDELVRAWSFFIRVLIHVLRLQFDGFRPTIVTLL